MKRFYTLIFFLYIFNQCARVQEYNYTHYGKKDWLAGETVYEITQDHNGFLWFGTETGLSRFDGKKFTNFTTTEGLSSNEVFGGMEDSHHRLWLTSFSNQICYYKDGMIYNKHNDSLLRNISFPETTFVITDNNDNIIICDNAHNVAVIDTNNNVAIYRNGSYKLDYQDLKVNTAAADLYILKLPQGLGKQAMKLLDITASSEKSVSVKRSSYNQIIFSLHWFYLSMKHTC